MHSRMESVPDNSRAAGQAIRGFVGIDLNR